MTDASGRAGYLVWEEEDADGGFPAYLDTINYLPADAPDEIGPSSDTAVLRSEETVRVPVHRIGDLAQTVPGVTVEVRQLHYTGGSFGDEWIRVYELDGRTVVANVTPARRVRRGARPDGPARCRPHLGRPLRAGRPQPLLVVRPARPRPRPGSD